MGFPNVLPRVQQILVDVKQYINMPTHPLSSIDLRWTRKTSRNIRSELLTPFNTFELHCSKGGITEPYHIPKGHFRSIKSLILIE